jgi:hypothetical protein
MESSRLHRFIGRRTSFGGLGGRSALTFIHQRLRKTSRVAILKGSEFVGRIFGGSSVASRPRARMQRAVCRSTNARVADTRTGSCSSSSSPKSSCKCLAGEAGRFRSLKNPFEAIRSNDRKPAGDLGGDNASFRALATDNGGLTDIDAGWDRAELTPATLREGFSPANASVPNGMPDLLMLEDIGGTKPCLDR